MSDVGLGANLQLDIQDALARVQQIASSLDAAVSGVPVTLDTPDASPVTASIDEAVGAADTTVTAEAEAGDVTAKIDDAVAAADGTVPVDADTSSATASLDDLSNQAASISADVPVDADTSAAADAIESVAAEADSTTASIEVDADTSSAQSAIDDLGNSASGTTVSLDGLTKATGALSGSTDSAAGVAAGLGSAVGSLGPEAAAAVGGIGALVAVTKSLFDAGLQADAAERRLAQTTGVYRDAVNSVQLGTFNGTLDQLGKLVGTSVPSLQNAAAQIFQVGRSAGVSGPQVAETTDKIIALAVNARNLKPALGDAGSVAESLSTSLSRGGRFLQQYGISLTADQIKQEAFNETGKTSVAQLTAYDKAAAGATLATNQLASGFGTNLSEALKNPTIRLAVLNNDFDLLKESLGKNILGPLIQDLTELEPTAEKVLVVIGQLIQAGLPLVAAFANVASSVSPILDVLAPVIGFLAKLIVGVVEVTSGIGPLSFAFTKLRGPIQDIIGPIELFIKQVENVGSKIDGFLSHIPGFNFAKDALKSFFDDGSSGADKFGEAIAGAAGAQDPFQAALSSTDRALQAQAVSYQPLVTAANQGATALAAVRTESSAAGDALDGLAADGINPTNEQLVDFAVRMNTANLSTQGLDNSAAALGITTSQLTAFLSGVGSALSSFVSKAVSGIPTVADAFKPVTTSAKGAGGAMQNTAEQALQAQRAIEQAQHGIEQANRQVADSNDALVKANADVVASAKDVATAQQAVIDAEKTLADLRKGPTPKDTEQANINLQRAQLAVADATDRVTQAQNDLENARAGATGSKPVAQAERDLQSAQLDVEQSTIDAATAQDALNTVRQIGTEQDPNVVAAEKSVATAHDGVTAAQQHLIDSQGAVVKAQQGVADSAYAVVQAEEALQEAINKPKSSGGGGAGGVAAEKVSLDQFVKNLDASTAKTSQFFDDIAAISAAGGTQIAGELAQLGVDAGSGYARQLAASIGPGNKSALVTSTNDAVVAHNKEIDKATKYLTETFGPQYIAGSGLIANLASTVFGSNLSFAQKIKIETAEAAGNLSTGAAAIALIAASGGKAAADAYAKQYGIAADVEAEGLKAVKTILGIDLKTPSATTGKAGADGFASTFAGVTATTDATLAANKKKIEGDAPAHAASGGKVGKAAGDAVGTSFTTGATAGIAGSASVIANTIATLNGVTAASITGAKIGEAFAQGVAFGMDPNQDKASRNVLSAASSALVAYAEKQVRAAADSHSPSLLFAEIGKDLTYGVAQGIGDPTATARVSNQSAKVIDIANAAALAQVQKQINATAHAAEQAIQFPTVSSDVAAVGQVADRFVGAGFTPDDQQKAATTGNGVSVQIDMGGFTFSPDTTPEQISKFIDTATESALASVRARQRVFFELTMTGR